VKTRSGLAIVLLFLSGFCWAEKPNPSDYTVAVHVQSSQLVSVCSGVLGKTECEIRLRLNVLIDGKRLVLDGKPLMVNLDNSGVLRTGDYKARLVVTYKTRMGGDDAPVPDYVDRRKYEMLFPDGQAHEFQLVGESE
jgi:hypothetical protein